MYQWILFSYEPKWITRFTIQNEGDNIQEATPLMIFWQNFQNFLYFSHDATSRDVSQPLALDHEHITIQSFYYANTRKTRRPDTLNPKHFISSIMKDERRLWVSVLIAMVDPHACCDFDSVHPGSFQNFNLALVVGRSNHCREIFPASKIVGFIASAARFQLIGAWTLGSCDLTLPGGEIKQVANDGKEAEKGAEIRNASANNQTGHFDYWPI